MELDKLIHQLRVLDCEKCYLCEKCHGYPDDLCLLYGEAADRLLTQQVQITQLEAELKEERYRHDRVQDFEVAESLELAKLREERRWIPVEERLPDVIDSYIVAIKYKYDHEKEYSYDTDVATYNPYEKAYIDDCWNTYIDWNEG